MSNARIEAGAARNAGRAGAAASTRPACPRVREQAREAVGLMAFSAAVSVGAALLLVLLAGILG